jgi:type IV secretion system protein VirD4
MKQDVFAKNGGIYLGFACSNTEGLPETLQPKPLQLISDRHVLAFGPTGSGKSRRLLLPNLINTTAWSQVVIDIKGELAFWTAEHRRKAGNEIIFLNPFNVLGLPSSGFNPVAALDPTTDFVEDAMQLAEALIREEGREPHWSASAQDLLCALIMYSRLTGPNDGSLGHVRQLLGQSSAAFVEDVKAMMKAGIDLGHEELTIKAARFRDLTGESRELNAILSTALTQTRWLDGRAVKADLARGNFDFSVMKQRPVTVFLQLPGNRLDSYSPWLRLMLTAIVQKLLKDVRPSKVPVMLMLDEAAQLHDPPIIRNSMTILRGYGVKLLSVFQDVAVAKSVLGEDRFLSNVANSALLSFAPQEMTSARFLSERSGERNADVLSYSSPVDQRTGMPAGGQLSFSQDKLPGILPQRLINMDPGYAVVFTHKTKGTVRSYLPDPSTMAGFEHIANGTPA